ncbi:DUF521 domain protein [Aspergillus ruber CBS 135680]|uniref:DUF521 domain protein n=1 Tax=Aspergillus ruber (strain CBS 135680) TaxID=1388766 RepID=A0A017S3I1_ASPRC|nr:DUF521 domain protein [Aspergillus ruber CBS 135680]EYE91189.1 DUF521 domain protein [Aspergillus ruber CBS 135680]
METLCTNQGTSYVQGTASGKLLASNIELSFWGGVNPQTGEIIDRHHTLSGQFLQDTILAIPGGRGSCSGSGVMLELLLNEKGPKAVLFERKEDILTLGVMIAEEVFGKAIPVMMLGPGGFREILELNGHFLHVVDGHIYRDEDMELSDIDRAFLDGVYGEAARVSMRIILRMGDLLGAKELMDITQVHVDGCIYTGPGSLIFAEKLRDWGGKVRVPTSLNSISIDQQRWCAQGIDPVFGEAAGRLADTYISMGAQPTFTCAPYQLESAPKLGEQVAWAESNAVVYANSILGAKTMKYPDFLDISIALTGRAPKGGPHVEANRLASLIVRVIDAGAARTDDSFYPLLGYHIGAISPSQIPVVVGIGSLSPCKDDLKAFGAAFATMSSAPMFHIVGVTPEAASLDAVLDERSHPQFINIEPNQLAESWVQLNSASHPQPVDLVSLGNPHFSLAEIRKLTELCRGRTKDKSVAITVTCGRSQFSLASQAGLIEELEAFGVQFITDTCWCMITEPIIPPSVGAIMTNSGKYAHYGPGLTGKPFYFGSLARCVEAACGDCIGDIPGWLSN